MTGHPAVFLDRDGTIIEDVGYLDRLERFRVLPYSIDAVRLLNQAGFRVVVVTNQAGVARGLVEESFVKEAHAALDAAMAAGGARIDRYYYCPHHPAAAVEAYRCDCECRKPQPGMLRQAERELDLDLSRSFLVGDKWDDIATGAAAGVRSILVRTGYGASEERRPKPGLNPDGVVDNLVAAVTWILLRCREGQGPRA